MGTYDQFGEDPRTIRSGDLCIATVKEQISPVFWGWLFQFGNQMRILSPDRLADDFRQQIAALLVGER